MFAWSVRLCLEVTLCRVNLPSPLTFNPDLLSPLWTDRGLRRCCPWASQDQKAMNCVGQKRWRPKPPSELSPSPMLSTARSMWFMSWVNLPPRLCLTHAEMVSVDSHLLFKEGEAERWWASKLVSVFFFLCFNIILSYTVFAHFVFCFCCHGKKKKSHLEFYLGMRFLIALEQIKYTRF